MLHSWPETQFKCRCGENGLLNVACIALDISHCNHQIAEELQVDLHPGQKWKIWIWLELKPNEAQTFFSDTQANIQLHLEIHTVVGTLEMMTYISGSQSPTWKLVMCWVLAGVDLGLQGCPNGTTVIMVPPDTQELYSLPSSAFLHFSNHTQKKPLALYFAFFC